MTNMDQDTTELREDSTKNISHDFDFYALKKIRIKQNRRLVVFSIVLIILLVLLVVFVILYMNAKKSASDGIKAKHTANDPCDLIQCAPNAICVKNKSPNTNCICKQGFVGDGSDKCRDINFVVSFKQRTIQNIPTLHNITFPQADYISICFWYKLRVSPGGGYKGVVSYTISGKEDFMVWFHTNTMTVISHNVTTRSPRKFVVGKWINFCWTGQSGKTWQLYLDGKEFHSGRMEKGTWRLPKTKGSLYLGQDHDDNVIDSPGQMFEGELSELFIYKGKLSKQDVLNSYNHKPRLNDVIVGWGNLKTKHLGHRLLKNNLHFIVVKRNSETQAYV
ncbi:uncharacterized protein LOC130656052 isoform X2 [Hydractinia symbiolongicarpus]|nr:uncharacterized protein LOC130656052 isoform X2 [Hydractinia symbiolongicarpus]